MDKCVLLKDHNAVTPIRLEPAALRSRVKHSTTEPLVYWVCRGLVKQCIQPYSCLESFGKGHTYGPTLRNSQPFIPYYAAYQVFLCDILLRYV